MNRFILISGCSGGGKSTLLDELRARGWRTVEEPGRRIVSEAADPTDPRLPWNNLACFAEAAITVAMEDYDRAKAGTAPVFFDRGLIDALVAYQHATGRAPSAEIVTDYRYNELAFFAPPWREIYVADTERRHDFSAAVTAESRRRRTNQHATRTTRIWLTGRSRMAEPGLATGDRPLVAAGFHRKGVAR